MITLQKESLEKKSIQITNKKKYDIVKLISLQNDQIYSFVKAINNKEYKSDCLFIDYLYDKVSTTNRGIQSKISNLFSKIFNSIEQECNKDKHEFFIFCKLLTSTNFGNIDICKIYINNRTLLIQGYKQTDTYETSLKEVMINSKMVEIIAKYNNFDCFELNFQVKKILKDRQIAYADDLVFATLIVCFNQQNEAQDLISEKPLTQETELKIPKKEKKNLFSWMSSRKLTKTKTADPLMEGGFKEDVKDNKIQIVWSDLLLNYHHKQFNYYKIQDLSMPQARTSATIIFNTMTDKNINDFNICQQNSLILESQFIETIDKLTCKILNSISPQMFIKNEDPTPKEKNNIEHYLKLFHNEVCTLNTQLQKVNHDNIKSFEEYKKLNNLVKLINIYTYQRNTIYNQYIKYAKDFNVTSKNFKPKPSFDRPLKLKIDEMITKIKVFLNQKKEEFLHNSKKKNQQLNLNHTNESHLNFKSLINASQFERDVGESNIYSVNLNRESTTFLPIREDSINVKKNQANNLSISSEDFSNIRNFKNYIQQVGEKAINLYVPRLQLEQKDDMLTNPNLKIFNNKKKRYNNNLMEIMGEKPAVIMHSPQNIRTYQLNRDFPVNLGCVNRLVSRKEQAKSAVPGVLESSIIYNELLELVDIDPLLLRDLSLKEFKWKGTNKSVIPDDIIVEDDEAEIDSEDEAFYGRKTIIVAKPMQNVLRRKGTLQEQNKELMGFKNFNKDLNKSRSNFRQSNQRFSPEKDNESSTTVNLDFITPNRKLVESQIDFSGSKSKTPPPAPIGLLDSSSKQPPCAPPLGILGQQTTSTMPFAPPQTTGTIPLAPPLSISGQQTTGKMPPPPPLGILGQQTTGKMPPPPPLGILGQQTTGKMPPPPPFNILGQQSTGKMPPPPPNQLGQTTTGPPPPPNQLGQPTTGPPPPPNQLGKPTTGPPPPPFGQINLRNSNKGPMTPASGILDSAKNVLYDSFMDTDNSGTSPPPKFLSQNSMLAPPNLTRLASGHMSLPYQQGVQIQDLRFQSQLATIIPNFLNGPEPVPSLATFGNLTVVDPSNKIKLKTQMWEAIKDNEKLQNSIWKPILTMPYKSNVQFSRLVELFEDKNMRKLNSQLSKSGILDSKISLITDEKRVQQLQIGVKKIITGSKANYDQLRFMIRNLDDSTLGYDTFCSLKNLIPQAHELEYIKSYVDSKKKIDDLDLPSRWVYEMRLIPRFATRIEYYVESNDFDDWYKSYKGRIDLFKTCFGSLRKDEKWLQILKLCLHVGNVLNEGTRRGSSLGIKCLSLKSFVYCKTNTNEMSLLEYVIKEIFDVDEDMLSKLDEISKSLIECQKYDVDETANEVRAKKRCFEKLKVLIENCEKTNPPDQGFITYFTKFFKNNIEKIISLETDMDAQQVEFRKCMCYLGEIESKVKDQKSCEYMKEYGNLFEKMSDAYKKLLLKREEERKTLMKSMLLASKMLDNSPTKIGKIMKNSKSNF